jgi:hypothetical protein
MPITMKVDHERRQIDAVAVGRICFAEIEHHLVEERCFNGLAYKEFLDARYATPAFVLYASEIRKIVALMRSLSKESKLGPTAILVGSDFALGVVHMLEIFLEDAAELKAFRNEDEARAWLASRPAAA